MTQLSIFDLPAQHHSPTSVQASITHAPTAASMEALALVLIRNAGDDGLTDEELQICMNDYQSARPRRIGLVRKGLVRDSGRTRQNSKGNSMGVWIATGI